VRDIGASILALACALQAPAAAAQPRDARALPAEVRAFITRRDSCDHFRGEEAHDAARAAEIARQLRASCTGTDAALARLKRIHARDRAVQRALARYEARVE
jgi:hypothetical protein